MVLNVKGNVKLSENLTTVIPKIISKAVQLQYSAFGRECNGVKKLNFSGTETYKSLLGIIILKATLRFIIHIFLSYFMNNIFFHLEVLNTKFPDTNNTRKYQAWSVVGCPVQRIEMVVKRKEVLKK